MSLLRVLLALLLSAAVAPAMAQPRAWLDRDRIALGETATLHVEVPSATAPPPDYSALRRDFELSGHASRRGIERTNGRTMAWTEYTVSLRPRRAGTLVIPSLAVMGGRTAPLTLQVSANPVPAPVQAGASVFIEAVADDAEPYVQQSVGWVVRLYSATPILSGQLDQPAPEGAALQRIGEDAMYTRDIGGRRYQVFERRYLLVPERSGPLVVPPARFQGRAAPSLFEDIFGRAGDTVRTQGRAQRLQVQPIPDDAPQPWLPLHALSLRYETVPDQARVGAAVNLTIEMTAEGAIAAQLPEIELPTVPGAQVFPEPPQSDERQVQGRPRTVVKRRFAIVPAQAGRLQVPGLRIRWWDVVQDRAREATLPAIVVPVAAATTNATAPRGAPTLAPPAEPTASQTPPPRGWIFATLAFAALWLVTLLWALQRRAHGKVPARDAPTDAPQPRPGLAQLRQALDVGDFADIEAVLRAMAPVPAPDTDAVMAQLADPAQRDALDALRRARWAGGDGVRARQQLRSAYAKGPRWHAPAETLPPLLPPLYPPR